MKKRLLVPTLSLALALSVAAVLQADVKKEEKHLVTFSGVLGRMANLFGGKAAKEGVVSTVAVSGNRKMTVNDTRGEIIDLTQQKVYDLDMRRKTYTVTTFEELRRRMAEMEAKAKEDVAKAPKDEQPQNQDKEFEVDFDVKNTGQSKALNGFDTSQVVVTVTVREKGKKLEQSGGLVMTADNWMTKSVPALKEITDFDMRYYKALAGPQVAVDAQQLATALVMMPGLKDAFARMQRAGLDGTAISSTTTVESVKSPEQMKQQEQSSADNGGSTPTSVGGAVGGAIGGFMRRRTQQNQQNNPPSARSTFMTINNEVLKIAPNATAADVAIPEGFKERN
jgi:hypothetical protein